MSSKYTQTCIQKNGVYDRNVSSKHFKDREEIYSNKLNNSGSYFCLMYPKGTLVCKYLTQL